MTVPEFHDAIRAMGLIRERGQRYVTPQGQRQWVDDPTHLSSAERVLLFERIRMMVMGLFPETSNTGTS